MTAGADLGEQRGAGPQLAGARRLVPREPRDLRELEVDERLVDARLGLARRSSRRCRARITVEEALIPVSDVVRGACELLGLDPLYVANEGRFVAFVPESDAGRALEILRSQTVSAGAVRAGTVYENPSGIVTLRSRVGGNRVLDMLSGEQLPRIC